MNPTPTVVRTRRTTRRAIAATTAIATLLTAAGPPRNALFRALAKTLIIDDSAQPADVIVVTLDGDIAASLEAADLVRAGIAPRVAVFDEEPSDAERELAKRGVPYKNAAELAIEQLGALGIREVDRIQPPVAGTTDEGRVLFGWCAGRNIRSVVVVTSRDHSRRVSRFLRRALAGRPIALRVHPARYSAFAPDSWWRTRSTLRTGIIELEKLMLDVALHPFS